MPSIEEIEKTATILVDCMLAVRRELGAGLLESTYQICLAHELAIRKIPVRREVELPVRYRGMDIATGYRIDMLVNECVIVENTSVLKILPVHEAQIITLSSCPDIR